MSTTILIALLTLIFFAQIFTWRKADAARAEAACATAAALRAEAGASCAGTFAQQASHTLRELTESGSPLMRAIAALPRKRAKKGNPQ